MRATRPAIRRRAAARAHALEGMTRAEVARLAGMERQASRDAVLRYNAEGLAGLEDGPKPGSPPGLTGGEQAALAAIVLRGPDLGPYRETRFWLSLNLVNSGLCCSDFPACTETG